MVLIQHSSGIKTVKNYNFGYLITLQLAAEVIVFFSAKWKPKVTKN